MPLWHGAGLDFIEEEQRFAWNYAASGQFEITQDLPGIKIPAKVDMEVAAFFKINFDKTLKLPGQNIFNIQVFPTCRAPRIISGFRRGESCQARRSFSINRFMG